MATLEIEIDGKKLTAEADQMVIQVADAAGIYIPRFCYHKHLSIAANCRMCLVEVEKSPKAVPACATPVMAGMKVFTKSAKAIAAQRAVMEFLLINHPLDCPICDQGGECELQDLAMGFGDAKSHYCEGKRAVKDEDLGPLIASDMTRCIQCTRCVRFGTEIAGVRELGATGRGEHMEIGTYVQQAITSEVSGNIIDVCPVGALTSKPFRFTARAWELNQYPSIAAHDCLGSNLHIHTRNGQVMRVAPRENIAINAVWLADRDRFSYEGLYHADRLATPKMRINNVLQPVSWELALETASLGLQRIAVENSPEQIAALASPNSTIEEFFLLQKIIRDLGSNNIDHRLRQTDFADQWDMPLFPGLPMPVAALEQCGAVLLIGSDIQREQPMAALRLLQAARKGAVITAVNMLDYVFHFGLSAKKIVAPDNMVLALASIAKLLGADKQPDFEPFATVQSDAAAHAIADSLRNKKQACLLLGASAMNHPQAAQIRQLARLIAELSGAQFGLLTEGANAAGAWLAGAVPHRSAGGHLQEKSAMNAQAMLADPRKAYVLMNVEPELDCANPAQTIAALEQAELVIALSVYNNPMIEQYADVILPITPFTETAGTFVNACGEWQTFQGVANAVGEARPGWKVLRVLGNFLQLDGFEFTSAEAVCHELKTKIETKSVQISKAYLFPPVKQDKIRISRIGDIPLYSADSLVRRASSLQQAQSLIEGELAAVRLHPQFAKALHLQSGEQVRVKQQHGREIKLPVLFDERVPENAALIFAGIAETAALGELFGMVEIHKG